LAYNVVYKTSVQRDLTKLSKAEVVRILDQIERELTKKPESGLVPKGQFVGLRKYRIGDSRVIYALMGTDILVLRIGNRRDVYQSGI
jgi:mRNA interferase RelE/StbE